MHWMATLESRDPHTDHLRGESFAAGDGAIIRLPEGGTAIVHPTGWTSYLVELPQWREILACRLVATNPQRAYPDSPSVYEDPAVSAILHGTRCARSLFALAHRHQDFFLDPVFPDCQVLAAAGSIPSISPSDLAAGRW